MDTRVARSRSRAAGLVLGLALDRVFGDPSRYHPVAGFGRLATLIERRTYRQARSAGVLHTSLLVGGTFAMAVAAQRCAHRVGPISGTALVAATTWACLGGTSLSRTGSLMAQHLVVDDLAAARTLLPSLCGRDPSALAASGLTRASVESIAENTSDAAVGVVFWGALGGVPAIAAYRAINTLDAMIGYRSPKYLRFGWFAARLDDVANLAPARLTGILTVVLAPAVGGRSRDAVTAWWSDASRHPSPNAGVAEATAAGALGVSLGGRTEYAHGIEIRPTLGRGRTPAPDDLRRAAHLSRLVQEAAVAVSAILAVTLGQADVVGRLRH